MSKTDDGGPAFPRLERVESWKHRQAHEEPEVYYVQTDGMSLRDWFAGQALAGMLAHEGRDDAGFYRAMRAYEMADAMLAARKQEPGE